MSTAESRRGSLMSFMWAAVNRVSAGGSMLDDLGAGTGCGASAVNCSELEARAFCGCGCKPCAGLRAGRPGQHARAHQWHARGVRVSRARVIVRAQRGQLPARTHTQAHDIPKAHAHRHAQRRHHTPAGKPRARHTSEGTGARVQQRALAGRRPGEGRPLGRAPAPRCPAQRVGGRPDLRR